MTGTYALVAKRELRFISLIEKLYNDQNAELTADEKSWIGNQKKRCNDVIQRHAGQ